MTQLPEHLRDLDRALGAVRFEPRASLGAELLGRFQRGDRADGSGRPGRSWLMGIAAGIALGLACLWLLAPRRGGTVTVDRCCQDLDGGGSDDDGLLVVTERGSRVRSLIVYEDRDGSRSFSPGDIIRFR
ncbi:MAG TPA: hypothetical protein VEI47_02140, partial [Gemmatimonadales bacterium]|nr:hypothetical protein [Gemmatimonadales bacterium]